MELTISTVKMILILTLRNFLSGVHLIEKGVERHQTGIVIVTWHLVTGDIVHPRMNGGVTMVTMIGVYPLHVVTRLQGEPDVLLFVVPAEPPPITMQGEMHHNLPGEPHQTGGKVVLF
jgi:hypothetical protein